MDKNTYVWTILRQPFLFPQNYAHDCEFEIFAFGKAGCLLCGQIHVCPSENCIVYDDFESGENTCTITGVIVKNKSFKEVMFH